MFRTTFGKGFHITFDNNITVSVQFGEGNYCANYSKMLTPNERTEGINSPDAEIAIWDNKNKPAGWLTSEFAREVLGQEEGDNVLGYCDAEIVFKALSWAKDYS